MPKPQNILVLRGGAIGDFVLTLPVLAALRRHYPGAGLALLGYPAIAQLALVGGLADQVRSLEAQSLASFFTPDAPLDLQWSDYFAGFTLMVSYLYDPEGVFARNVARCSPAQFIVGPHRPGVGVTRHVTEVLLEPLAQLGIVEADSVPRLNLSAATKAEPVEVRWLGAHPGSGSERKNWPEVNWAKLLTCLLETTNFNLLLIGGEAEAGRLKRLAAILPPSRTVLAYNWPLTELARRLKGCAGYTGHDSGISHLAAALQVPGFILWGDTEEAVWRPRGDRLRILRDAGGLEAISVARVIEALKAIIPDS
jgi:ADP-heptose:LPS heptosyltransferase